MTHTIFGGEGKDEGNTSGGIAKNRDLAAQDEAVLAGLNEEQRAVATCIEGPLAVIAGAGTGKTRAITHRIAHAVLCGAYSPDSVLAVTFTTRAAGEMRGRLRQLGVPRVQARTFHSAALRQIRYFWPRVTGKELPDIAGSTFGLVIEAARRNKIRADTAVIRDLSSEISWAKSTNVLPSNYVEIAERMDRDVAGIEPENVAKVMSDYERAKRRQQVIDYDDILLCAVSLMHEHPEVAAEFQSVYKHFVVDEYQDVSPLQHNLLAQWLGDRQEICVVGDPDQAIHSFAGADPRFLLRFEREFSSARVLRMARNYRSTPQILQRANELLHPARKPAVGRGVVLRPMMPDGAQVTVTPAADEQAEAEQVADWLIKQHQQGTDWREMAVLFRVSSQSPAVEAAFDDKNVPYQVHGVERFYERAEIRTALARLQTAASADPSAEPLAATEDVLVSVGWSPQAPSGQGRVRERWESWNALRDLAEQLAQAGVDTFAELITQISERAAIQQAPSAGGVTLSTMHSAKGLEWDCVGLIGVREGLLPFVLAKTPIQIAEERRLFYVAITRARKNLRISWASGGQNTRARKPSRFLGMTQQEHSIMASQNGISIVRKPKKVAKCIVCGRPLADAVAIKLGHHEQCEVSFDQELLERLKAWRLIIAKAHKLPAYTVFTDATLTAVAQVCPKSMDELGEIRGIGAAKLKRYGQQVLELVGGSDPAVAADFESHED